MNLLLSFGVGSLPDECAALVRKTLSPLGRSVTVLRGVNLAENTLGIPGIDEKGVAQEGGLPTVEALERVRARTAELLTNALGPPSRIVPLQRRFGFRTKWWFTIDIEARLPQQWRYTRDELKARWLTRTRPAGSLPLTDESESGLYEYRALQLIAACLNVCKRWGYAGTYAAHRVIDSWPFPGLGDDEDFRHAASVVTLADFAYRPLDARAGYEDIVKWHRAIPEPKWKFLQHRILGGFGEIMQPYSEIRDAVRVARKYGCGLALWERPSLFMPYASSANTLAFVEEYAEHLLEAMKETAP